MPKGYLIVTQDVHDRAGLDHYGQQAFPTLAGTSGRPLVANDHPDVIEGEWHGPRTVILEFDSVTDAQAWYHSPAYQGVVGLRHAAAACNGIIVEGLE